MRIPRTAWVLLAIAALVAVFIALFNWNWLRGPISTYMSAKFGRPFIINGDLRGEFSLKPQLSADYVTLGNSTWSSDPIMARAQHLTVRVDLLSLLGGPVSLPELTLVRPVLLL